MRYGFEQRIFNLRFRTTVRFKRGNLQTDDGGIYDDRLLVKPTDSAKALLPNARYELPYDGAKAMLFVDCVDDKELLEKLFSVVYEDLPLPKKKK